MFLGTTPNKTSNEKRENQLPVKPSNKYLFLKKVNPLQEFRLVIE